MWGTKVGEEGRLYIQIQIPFITQLALLSPGCTLEHRNMIGRLSNEYKDHVMTMQLTEQRFAAKCII